MPRFYLDEDDVHSGDENMALGREQEPFKVIYQNSVEEKTEEEPPHPLGFSPSWGRTRFSVEPIESLKEYRQRHGFADKPLDRYNDLPLQTFPPLEFYVQAPTQALLLPATTSLQNNDDDLEETMDQLTQMWQRQLLLTPSPQKQRQLVTFNYQTLDSASQQREVLRIQQQVEQQRQRMQQEHSKATRGFQSLLEQKKKDAEFFLREQKRLQEQREQREQQEREEEEKRKQKEKDAQEQAKLDKQREIERRAAEEKKRIEKEKAEREAAAAAAENTHAAKAKKLIDKLVQLRASIEPFEKSKAVSKRRLQMKKIVRGKVNTLSENADKIKAVAQEVANAVTQAREEDDHWKKRIEARDPQVTPEMARGKRYLLDLLASSVIVRVQAEGFNGPRGDGFPLANMLALVSLENKEFVLILAAHIYTVCPIAIPALPTIPADASEEQLMEGLGMQKNKNGEYETFERFLARTEGIISLVANIQVSRPSTHPLMGGNKGAMDWLTRFLDLLPAAPQSPLPLLTAPVLNAFLVSAGHMLANKHPDFFREKLKTITDDIAKRLDDGPIGGPSAIRLNKTLAGGFEAFRTTLPSRALPNLYSGANQGGRTVSSSSAQSGPPPPSPFGAGGTSISGESDTAFGQTQGTSPFGTAGASTSGTAGASTSGESKTSFGKPQGGTSPFGGTSSTVPPNPFGGTSNEASKRGGIEAEDSMVQDSNSNPFAGFGSSGGNSSSDPFGANKSSSGGFGASNMSTATASPFGTQPGGAMPSATPFGQATPNASPFGQPAGGSFGTTNNTPFGGGNNQTPFGAGGDTSTGKSPFGQPTGGTTGNSPFGGGNAPNNSPFGGGGTMSSGATPFGKPSGGSFGTTNSSPFGGGTSQGNNPFGGGATSSPFGGPSTSSPFGGGNKTQNTPFGGTMSSNTSQTSNSPFGGGNTNQNNPFGGGNASSNASPFGQPAGAGNSPFGGGNSQNNNPFGGGSTQNSNPFGGGNSQNNNPFGGGNSQNNNPFGGGNSQNNNPFGGGKQNRGGGGKRSNSRGGNRPPCRFFAEGRCHFGDKCRFSHETPASGGFGGKSGKSFGGGSNATFGNASPFGQPRR